MTKDSAARDDTVLPFLPCFTYVDQKIVAV